MTLSANGIRSVVDAHECGPCRFTVLFCCQMHSLSWLEPGDSKPLCLQRLRIAWQQDRQNVIFYLYVIGNIVLGITSTLMYGQQP